MVREHHLDALDLTVRRASPAEILPLRQAVIMAGTNRTTPEYPGDHDATTMHFGAFHAVVVVGCGTFLVSDWESEPAWQLRGMATDPAWQKKGVGAAVLAFAEDHIRANSPTRMLWCNARLAAVNFYVREGWVLESEAFPIEGVGIHRKMSKRLLSK